MADDGPERAAGHSAADRPTRGEYAVGTLGLLLVLALLAFLGYQALAVRQTGPQLTATVTGIEQVEGGWQARFTVRNTGGAAVAQVEVTGTLESGGTSEEATATLDHVPAQSSRGGALLFTTDPRSGRLEVRPVGYALP
ncbi:hypothetical protein [Geodermatophilus sp. SYSU D01119]